ncbi:D-amino acid dehydrogenase [Novispirillum itersonii]|uniref:D-amino acid dehydrogenase n=1 Tax=Novispirillum itersonii TaxID=189 RepID=UPI00247FD1C7|nr:D-amino acid dehydrogenase [Novispirillum itersonii]
MTPPVVSRCGGCCPMNVLVLGAGVVGTTSAYFLARAGHTVTVIDRQPGVALETSFANGGQISPSHAIPWANPETVPQALRWLGRDDAPLVFRPFRYDPALWLWLLRFLRNCTPGRTAVNIERTVRIALHSRDVLRALRADTGIQYDALSKGILHVFRNQQAFDEHCKGAEVMSRAGLPQTVIPRVDLPKIEPALSAVSGALVGGLLATEDESGDVHKFTRGIATLAAGLGVTFRFGETVHGLDRDGDRISAVVTDKARHTADAVVLALGSFSPGLARTLGFRLPIYPAKGYSITLQLAGPEQADAPGAPVVSVTDDERKIVSSRLGDRLRVAGTAELAGWDPTLRPARADLIRRHAADLFPLAGDYATATPWCGLRPKTPDSVPYIGASPVKNLWLNTGHGTLGWTMAAGSGQILADLISGRSPAIDVSGYRFDR